MIVIYIQDKLIDKGHNSLCSYTTRNVVCDFLFVDNTLVVYVTCLLFVCACIFDLHSNIETFYITLINYTARMFILSAAVLDMHEKH